MTSYIYVFGPAESESAIRFSLKLANFRESPFFDQICRFCVDMWIVIDQFCLKTAKFCYSGVFEVAEYEYDTQKQRGYTWGSALPGTDVFYRNIL